MEDGPQSNSYHDIKKLCSDAFISLPCVRVYFTICYANDIIKILALLLPVCYILIKVNYFSKQCIDRIKQT